MVPSPGFSANKVETDEMRKKSLGAETGRTALKNLGIFKLPRILHS